MNDLDDDITSNVLKFVYDNNCLGNISYADRQHLQDDFNIE